LAATDVNGTASAQITVAVNPQAGVSQGWIGSPVYGSQVSGIVPIKVASGVTLGSGVLTVYPANNPSAVTVLNANTTGSGQIGSWDTTQINNGTYWITLQATTTSGSSEYNLALVTVVGNYKPGRVVTTVTDLVVPVNGLPIKIQRTYDSLNASTSGDFGYGWNLSTSVDLSVDPKGDVTFTLGGIRHTFYLTPQFLGWLFPYYVPAFTAEAGFHGTLNANGAGCANLFDFLEPDGSLWACIGGGYFTPSSYVYTDPTGTSYLISTNGNLQAIVDKNGNRIDIRANGITSTMGLSVPFVRDSSGRITSITDPQGNVYQYGYDPSGNLATVTYPNTPISSTYTYDSNHFYLSGTDFNNKPLPSTSYYTSTDTDSNGLPLNGRLKSVTDALGETTSYAYNLKTNTTSITYPADGGGNVGTATMVYSSAGDLLSTTDPLGHATTNTYDANRNLISVTDPMHFITCYTYDSNGNRTSVSVPQATSCSTIKSTATYNQYSEPTQTTDEDGNTRSFNYDANFNPSSVTDSLGTLASFQFNANGTMAAGAVGFDISANPSKASQFTYDANGNLASRTDALGRTTSYTYNSLGQKITMVEPLPSGTSASAATTTYTYDAFGNLTQTAAPLGRTTSSTYDGNGNKLTDIDARRNTTSYVYDALNRLSTTTYPTSPTTTSTKTYDFRGNVITETDQAGHITQHVYDLAGRQTSVTQAYGTSSATTTTYAYDNAGRKTSETDALGHTTTYSYDAAGDLTGVSGVNGTFSYAYDNARNRVSMTDGNNNTTQYQYDARKRLVTTTYPDTTTKTNTYDGAGNLTSVTDQNGNVVEYTYDAANQLQSVTQTNSPNAPNNVTSYGYNVLGDITGLTDANSHLTENAFDLLSRPVSKTLPDGSLTETRQYDAAGNLTSVTHFNGKTTTYAYDALNRLLSRTPDSTTGEPAVSFTYTATGKRASMTDASGTTNYTYDSMDRLITKATPEGTLNYTYDAAGHVASMTSSHSNGVSVSYTYDTLNRLSTVVDGRLAGNQTTTYTYDPANNVATVTYPNTVQTVLTYDQLNRLKQLATSQTGYLYTFDNAGNRKTASEYNGRSVTWNFDGIDRLNDETITGAAGNENGTASYVPDPVGNRQSATSSIPGLTPIGGTFNPDDELASESYDQNGNVTRIANGKTFAYDAENHLVSMGSTVALIYDGDGNRVSKTVSGVTTRYLVDDLNPTGYAQVVEELSGSGSVQRQYTYGLQRISQNQVVSNTWTPSFYGYDGFGTVRQLTSTSGTITDTYDYDAFGNKVNSTGTTPNSYLYRGEQYDSDLGLYYLRARYYNPLTGRFMGRDPWSGNQYDPKMLHKYLYVASNPVSYVDPRGTDLFEYAMENNAAVPEAKLVSIYNCFSGATLTAASLALTRDLDWRSGVGSAGAVFGCVSLYFPENSANAAVQTLLEYKPLVDYGFCGFAIEAVIHDLNDLVEGKGSAGLTLVDSLGALNGCVGTKLSRLVESEGGAAD
jgi:RHS repeat-associated protein